MDSLNNFIYHTRQCLFALVLKPLLPMFNKGGREFLDSETCLEKLRRMKWIDESMLKCTCWENFPDDNLDFVRKDFMKTTDFCVQCRAECLQIFYERCFVINVTLLLDNELRSFMCDVENRIDFDSGYNPTWFTSALYRTIALTYICRFKPDGTLLSSIDGVTVTQLRTENICDDLVLMKDSVIGEYSLHKINIDGLLDLDESCWLGKERENNLKIKLYERDWKVCIEYNVPEMCSDNSQLVIFP